MKKRRYYSLAYHVCTDGSFMIFVITNYRGFTMCKNEQYTYNHPKIEHYTDNNMIVHEVHSYMADTDDGMIQRKKDYYTDERGVKHSFYYCEHCDKPIENTHRCGDHIYCSMKCANEALSEEMKNFKPKKIREIRVVNL